MILIILKHTYFFHLALFKKYFNHNHDLLFFCGQHFNNPSFRLSEKSKFDKLIPFRILKKLIVGGLKKNTAITCFNKQSNEAIFDSTSNMKNLRVDYIQYFNKTNPGFFISKDYLIGYLGFWHLLSIFLLLTIFFIPLLVFSIFSNDKKHYPLFIQELIESINLNILIKKHKIKVLHYFCIYERDANICSYLLIDNDVYVNKIASEVPLYFYNKIVVATQLVCCIPYQLEEFKAYKKTMFVEQTVLWGPESILQVPKRLFLSNKFKNTSITHNIGFFSSGNWLRNKLGHIHLDRNEEEYEKLLFLDIKSYCSNNKLSFIVFLHPLEKKPEYISLTESYYKKFNLNPEFDFAPVNQKSIEGFDCINIGIALYSTLMFERLSLGFKTLIAPVGYDDFPLPNSTFNNICVKDKSDLESKLNFNLPLDTNDFFRLNKIQSLILHNIH